MKRRNFLAMLGLAPFVAKFTPFLDVPSPTRHYRTYIVGDDAIFNISSMPPPAEEAFAEIAKAEEKAQEISGQYKYVFNYYGNLDA